MVARIDALVEPALLVWARATASLTIEEAAERAGVEVERLQAWEAGDQALSISQLKKLAGIYKRPLSVFFLPEPPKTFAALRDLRRLPEASGRISKALAYEIRAAQERRNVAIDLYEDLGEGYPEVGITAKVDEDPEAVARRVRTRLGVDLSKQVKWRQPDAAFRGWREAIENSGVLVSVLGGAHHQVPLSEVRGFAIAEQPVPMIAVNAQDRSFGRVFTLMHELAHVALGESVYEDELEDLSRLPAPNRATETFCNRVAAAVLMPKDALFSERLLANAGPESAYSDEDVSYLAQRYGVSREALLVRLADLRLADNAFVAEKRAEYARIRAAQKDMGKEEQNGFPPHHTMIVSHLGRGFARLVLQAYNNRRLTLSTAAAYLGAQAAMIPKIERAAFNGGADL
jgi:Zn-dependent peptidase ImmA (M78 family)/transcriptional regulator with XRE-family HTH domain